MSTTKIILKKIKNQKVDLRNLQTIIKKEKKRKWSARLISLEGKQCELCGTKDNLTRHHVEYKIHSVQILCIDCHKKLHQKD